MNILLIQTAFIGDVILATALVEKLKNYYPDCTIDFLVRKGNENILKNNPHIRHLLLWDKKQSKIKNLLLLTLKVRRSNYQYVINCQRFFSTGLLTACSGAKNRIGFDKNPLSFLFTSRINHTFESVHETTRNQQLIASFTDSKASKPKIYPDEMPPMSFGYERYITISPASVWFTKQYPQEKWISFINQLNDQLAVVLIGGKEDKELADRIKKEVKSNHRVCVLAGRLTLLESAKIMKDAAMNYVNDSAPLHLCSAVNAPVCVVYCSTVPNFGFGPLSDQSHIVQVQDLPCRPCGIHGKKVCPEQHFKCALDIDQQKMLDLVA